MKHRRLGLGLALGMLLAGCAGGQGPPIGAPLPGAAAPTITLAPTKTPAPTSPAAGNGPRWLPQVFGKSPVPIAVIGDYGVDGPAPGLVGGLVASWQPEAVFTTGDNNYPVGAAETIDPHIGQHYHRFIAPYLGVYGPGAERNQFFPALGNHDWLTAGAAPYLDYFALPGNERYYEVAVGPTRWFVLDSDPNEPDGVSADSIQGRWLRDRLAAAEECWKIVTMHHPPYSSAAHGSNAWMQWPFAEWGADLVLGGHDHDYERIERGGMTYVVNGLGGAAPYGFPAIVEGSVIRYNARHGAMRLLAGADSLLLEFVTIDGELIDSTLLEGGCAAQP
ncbi:MAG TPA: metallophosphoesterase [Herpetosiphonaceae bacterium]